MTIRRVLLAFAVFSTLTPAGEILHISTRSPKPLQDICLELLDKLHWRISYEDPPVLAQDELVLDQTPGRVPRMAMRAVPMSVDVPTLNSNSVETKHSVMKSIIDRYNRSGNRAVFRDVQVGDSISVMPVAVRDEGGNLQSFQPMLDTPVTITRGTYSLGALVEDIMAQVSQKRGIPIVRATVPINIFAQSTVTEEAYNEPARDVLTRAFEEINGPRLANHGSLLRLVWYLLYNPNGRHYFLNVHNVFPEEHDSGSAIDKNTPPTSKSEQPIPGSRLSKTRIIKPN